MDGSLTIDQKTFKMTIRKGDTGSVCFRFNKVVTDCTFWFVVKESISQSDADAPIYQEYEYKGGTLLLIKITEEESDRLTSSDPNSTCICRQYKDYIWALKYVEHLKDEEGNFIGLGTVKTLVPKATRRPPIFRVYPEIIEGPNV